jgi:hypothetical protein
VLLEASWRQAFLIFNKSPFASRASLELATTFRPPGGAQRFLARLYLEAFAAVLSHVDSSASVSRSSVFPLAPELKLLSRPRHSPLRMGS